MMSFFRHRKSRRALRPDGFSYDRRIKNDRRLSYSVQNGLLGLDVEQVDLVGIEGNADGVSVAGLGGGSDAGGHLVALVLQVQVDLSAHHLRDIDDEPEFMAKHTDCQLDTQVDVSEMMGAEIYLYLEYKGNKMTARVAPTSKARNGDTVRVAFDPHKVHLFDIETEQTILN